MAKITDKYNIKDNTYFQVAKSDPRDFIDVEIGDSKQPDFYPQIKVKRWDNEVNFSMRLIHDEKEISIIEDEEKIKWQGKKIDVNLYDLPESEELPEGGYEFEVILKEKPATNVIEFSLNTKGLDFFYQPEIGDEEALQIGIDKGVTLSEAKRLIRPERIVGSYAIYRSDKKENYANGKKYRCNKVGHIYRPRIEDAEGNWCWGTLNIDLEKSLLKVTIPQDFLNKAIYPVRHAAGTTVGYGGNGESTEWWYANNTRGNTFAFSAGTIQKISSYAYEDYSGDLYTKSYLVNESTGAITGDVSGGVLAPTGSKTWYDATFGTNPTVTATNYRIVNVVSVGTANYGLGYDSGLTAYYNTAPGQDYDSPVDWDDYYTNSNGDKQYSIYATYEEGGSGVVKTATAKARVKKIGNIKTATAKARAKQPNQSRTEAAKARVEQPGRSATIQAKSRMKNTLGKTAMAKGRIQSETMAVSAGGLARILHPSELWSDIWAVDIQTGTFTATVRAKARIKKLGNSVGISAKARIKQSGNIRTVIAKSRIERSDQSFGVEAKGRIETTSSRTVQSKSRIEKTMPPQVITDSWGIEHFEEIGFGYNLYLGVHTGVGQTFTANIGGQLARASFYFLKYGSPTGTLYAKIYTLTGNYGYTATPDVLLATSDPVDAATLQGMTIYTPRMVDFIFSGNNQIQLEEGTYYVLTVEYLGGNASNHFQISAAAWYPEHYGNTVVRGPAEESSWTGDPNIDTFFYVFLNAGNLKAKARIKHQNNLATSQAKARVELTGTAKTILSKARIKKFGASRSVTAKARIGSPGGMNIDAKAAIKQSNIPLTISAKARIEQQNMNKAVSAKANIVFTRSPEIETKARIKSFGNSQSIAAKSYIHRETGELNISAKARIKIEDLSPSIQAKARIKRAGRSATGQSKARISAPSLAKTITAKSRVKRSGDAAGVQAKARIRQFNIAKTATAKARIWAFASGYVKMRRGDQQYILSLFSSDDLQILRSGEQNGIIVLYGSNDHQELRSVDQSGILTLLDKRIL